MRAHVLVLLAIAACSPPFEELILAVDGDDAIVAGVGTIRIEVSDGAATVDNTEVQITGVKPFCLPFSLGIAPREGHEDLPLSIAVRAHVGETIVARTIDTRFEEGTALVAVMLDGACLDGSTTCETSAHVEAQPIADRDALISAMTGALCRRAPSLEECIDRGGCATSSSAPSICSPACAIETLVSPPMPPSSPLEVAAPTSTCPPGWTREAEADTDAIAVCEPWATHSFFGCLLGQARFPGADGCTPLGASCPSGDFNDALPAMGVVYVNPNAPAGGDGSRALPFQNLADALASAADGEIIALSKGTVALDPVLLDRPLELAGACAESTRLVRNGAPLGPLFTVTSSSVFMHDLAISGADRAVSINGGVLHLDALELDASAGSALIAGGTSSLIAHSVVISGSGATALILEDGAHASLAAIDINAASGGAIRVSGSGATLQMRDVSLRTVATGGEAFGFGVLIERGGNATIERALFENVEGHSIYAAGAGTYLSLAGVLVRDTAPAPNGTLGHAVQIQDSAQASLVGVAIARARHAAIQVSRAGPVIFTDVVVHDTLAQANDRELGYGIACDGCILRGARISIARATRNALDFDSGADIELGDIAVRDTRPAENDQSIGTGMVASRGTHVVLTRAIFERTHLAAMFLQENTIIELHDLIVRDSLEEASSGYGGFGAFVKAGVRFDVSRAIFERCRTAGIDLLTGETLASTASLEDVFVHDTSPSAAEPNTGRGIRVEGIRPDDPPIVLHLLRTAIEDSFSAGFEASDVRVDAFDLSIKDSKSDAGDLQNGAGLSLATGARFEGARLTITGSARDGAAVMGDAVLGARDFLFAENMESGVRVGEDASVDLFEGELFSNATGATLSPSYDLGRIAGHVRFRGNQRNIARER